MSNIITTWSETNNDELVKQFIEINFTLNFDLEKSECRVRILLDAETNITFEAHTPHMNESIEARIN